MATAETLAGEGQRGAVKTPEHLHLLLRRGVTEDLHLHVLGIAARIAGQDGHLAPFYARAFTRPNVGSPS